jgi:ATP-dependent protease ClpP protease subunit
MKQTQQNFTIQIIDLDDEDYIAGIITDLLATQIGPEDKVTVLISCYGGSLELTLHLMHTLILLFDDRITTKITSHAYSAAGLLFMIGTDRYAFEESSLMLHDYTIEEHSGKSYDLKEDLTFNTLRYKNLLEKYFGAYLGKDTLGRICAGGSAYFTGVELRQLNIATHLYSIELEAGESDV